ncbi:hypothetical protein F4779DRAFT_575769 [Xylariaceae sp. FL0662B]|nr:hypothetical protein F4779DRAFT_575769 [Xylariaceae sp. FL0662B]
MLLYANKPIILITSLPVPTLCAHCVTPMWTLVHSIRHLLPCAAYCIITVKRVIHSTRYLHLGAMYRGIGHTWRL